MTAEIATIWDDFHKELKAFVQNKTRNSADTDDILQDAFIKILKNWDKVNHSENLRLYLFGIVRNTMYDHLKKKPAVSDAVELKAEFTVEDSQNLNATIADCCIKPLIAKLPEQYREALTITEFHDVSQKELAEKLGISYSGAKSRVQRGKAKLKELILKCCPYKSDAYGNIFNSENSGCHCS